MQRISFVSLAGTLLVGFGAIASADDTADIIERDKAWGAAGTKGDTGAVAKLLADNLVSVSGKGVTDKKGELAANEPAPAGTQYEPTDYKVTFIDKDTAVMTHGTKGADAHYSMHVWSRKGGQWQVVATSTTPVEGEAK
jgi:ketosteroid isomerase-like protein